METEQSPENHQVPIRKDTSAQESASTGGLPSQQGAESQTKGIQSSPEVLARELKILQERPQTVWEPLIRTSKADFDKALAEGRMTQEEYDEEMEYSKIVAEREQSKQRDAE